MPTYDSNITKTPKPSAPSYTVNAKPTASYTINAKPTASYSINAKPTASYTITGKATRPTTTRVPKPYTEPLAITTEDGVDILYESGITMIVQGAL